MKKNLFGIYAKIFSQRHTTDLLKILAKSCDQIADSSF